MITGNTHFAIATHVLTALAFQDSTTPLTSTQLAESIDTNPAFLRAVLGRLRDAGLVRTQLGKGGGAFIARPAESITLLDVYRATEGRARVSSHDCSASACIVARTMPEILARIDRQLDSALATELSKTTVADLRHEVRQHV